MTVALAGCGADDGPEAGDEVEGRAPTTVEDGGPTESAPPGDEAPTTVADGPTAGPLDQVTVALEPFMEADAPVKLLARPGSDVLYVAQQGGEVLRVDPAAADDAAIALDLTEQTVQGQEQGLLGLAFSPDGATLYVHHSGTEGETRVAAYDMDGDDVDPASRVDLLEVDQPFPNHNGGDILVSPDGLLWIGLGDGGNADDPDQRAQDPDDLLGKVLRIDPTTPGDDRPYGIPADNPFADGGGRPEVAVIGVRNPWRMRFDEATGDLWIADVGQGQLEEIDLLPAGEILGANLGWSRWEGSQVYLRAHPLGPGAPVGPVFEMDHADEWCSVTGGPVYRGSAIPDLVGAYLFGDFCRPGLSALRMDGAAVGETAVLDEEVASVVSVDVDAQGEVYVLSLAGTISRLVPA